MNAAEYLARIGYDGPLEPSPETLAGLQRAHLLSVPFENLDIHLGRRLVLDRSANFDKIVRRRRGGWCYELNGLFSWLLEELGFRVTLLGSRVEGAAGAGQDLAHLLLLVDLDRPYIADVGFGESSLDPIALERLPDHVIPAASTVTSAWSSRSRRGRSRTSGRCAATSRPRPSRGSSACARSRWRGRTGG